MLAFRTKTRQNVETAPSSPDEDIDRRESVLNARIAEFEKLMRQQAEDSGRDVRVEATNASQLEQTADELEKVADALEAREKKMAELAANLRTRENALLEKTRDLETLGAQLARKQAEAQQISLRLLAAQEEMNEKERLFEERSHRALETIKVQKDELKKLREAA
ncbi:MAG: hypothetical protein J6X44_07635 [Thermoguttaceae bacterium]|nr:hypothetical protein [Thermoguttaceae bacterium]